MARPLSLNCHGATMRRAANKDYRTFDPTQGARGETVTALKKLDGVALNAAESARTIYATADNHSYAHIQIDQTAVAGGVTNLVCKVYTTMDGGTPFNDITSWQEVPASSVSPGVITVGDGTYKRSTGGAAVGMQVYAMVGAASKVKAVISGEGTTASGDTVDVYLGMFTP